MQNGFYSKEEAPKQKATQPVNCNFEWFYHFQSNQCKCDWEWNSGTSNQWPNIGFGRSIIGEINASQIPVIEGNITDRVRKEIDGVVTAIEKWVHSGVLTAVDGGFTESWNGSEIDHWAIRMQAK